MSRQVILSYAELAQALPSSSDAFIEDYFALKEDVTNLKADLSPLFGEGSPVGLVASNTSRMYYDTALSPVSVKLWFSGTIGTLDNWVEVV